MTGKTVKEGRTLEEVSAVLKVLADPNRLRIFAELMEGDSCNCELKEKLDLPSNLLSHHLRQLRLAGLVNSRRDVIDGRWIYYAADRDEVGQWHDWFAMFLDPQRIRSRNPLCGPEGKTTAGAVDTVLNNELVASALSGG